jgi:capsule polysaccharide export protein KpsE/RkpR
MKSKNNFERFKELLFRRVKDQPILFPTLTITILYLGYLLIFLSPVYKSDIVLEIDSDSSGPSGLEIGLFSAGGSISGSSSELFKLKTYLESSVASSKYKKIIDTENFFSRWSIDFFSKYKPWAYSFNEYYNDKIIEVDVLSESGALLISVYGFKPEEALQSSLAILLIVDSFFQDRLRINSKLKRLNKECELGIIQSTLFNNNNVFESGGLENFPIENFNSAYDLLTYLAEKAANICQDYVQNEDTANNSPDNKQINLPSNIIRELNYSSLKDAISNYYLDSLNILRNSNYISLIAEPQLPQKAESKGVIFSGIIVLIFNFLVFLTIRIILRLRRDFSDL